MAKSRSTTLLELEKLRLELQAQRSNLTIGLNARYDDLRESHLARLATRSELIDGAVAHALDLTTDVGILVERFGEERNKRVGATFTNVRCECTSQIMLSGLDYSRGLNISKPKVVVGKQDDVIIVPSAN